MTPRRMQDQAVRLGQGLWTPTGGIAYLLRDEFITNLAAGSVNGTKAEPGPGTRVVVDTGNVLSIAGGVATCAAPTGLADPLLGFSSPIIRAAGVVGIMRSSLGSTGNRRYLGFDDGLIAVPDRSSFFITATLLQVYDSGAYLTVGSIVETTPYDFTVVLRAAGAFYFIKGGAFTNWTLLWIGATDNTASLYLSHGWRTNAASIGAMRVPSSTWLPVPLLSDSFNRANGALGITDGAGHAEANGGGGLVWNNRVGTTQIATNAASASALVGGIAIATVDVGNDNVLHKAKLTRSAGNVGIVLRYVDADNYVYAYHDGTNAVLVKVVAGTPTTVITAAATYAAGAELLVIPDGTSFSLFYNNTKVGSTSTISDAGLQTGTEFGLYSSDTGNSQDDCVGWSRKTGYNKLSKF